MVGIPEDPTIPVDDPAQFFNTVYVYTILKLNNIYSVVNTDIVAYIPVTRKEFLILSARFDVVYQWYLSHQNDFSDLAYLSKQNLFTSINIFRTIAKYDDQYSSTINYTTGYEFAAYKDIIPSNSPASVNVSTPILFTNSIQSPITFVTNPPVLQVGQNSYKAMFSNNTVTLDSAQTIAGPKTFNAVSTFNSRAISNNTSPNAEDLVRRDYVDKNKTATFNAYIIDNAMVYVTNDDNDTVNRECNCVLTRYPADTDGRGR
jgi:hypothetical protein